MLIWDLERFLVSTRTRLPFNCMQIVECQLKSLQRENLTVKEETAVEGVMVIALDSGQDVEGGGGGIFKRSLIIDELLLIP